jgi:hypothetical protein
LVALLGQSIPESRAHDGCEDIMILQNQDDWANIVSLTTWTTRRHHEQYLAWRTEMGTPKAIPLRGSSIARPRLPRDQWILPEMTSVTS